MTATTTLTTALATATIAWGRAPRCKYADGWSSEINRRIVCADGFKVSIQASARHYANDSSPEAPYWSMEEDPTIAYPFTTFEVGNPDGPLPDRHPWDEDNGGIWPWVPVADITALLDLHGGAESWEVPHMTTANPAAETCHEPAIDEDDLCPCGWSSEPHPRREHEPSA